MATLRADRIRNAHNWLARVPPVAQRLNWRSTKPPQRSHTASLQSCRSCGGAAGARKRC